MTKIKAMLPEQLAKSAFKFTDSRLPEMLFRYRARNYPQTLNADEQLRWNAFCIDRLTGHQAGGGILLADYFKRLEALRNAGDVNANFINDLEAYAREKMHMLGMQSV